MNASTIGCYLFGNANAIREVANDRTAFWTGVVLVLITGIARNYDQNYFRESPFWLIGPLLFSYFSGSYLYWFIIRVCARPRFETRPENQWTTFMALFWMTAPVAWLYAIPVERFFDSYRATQANLTLLAIVSLWRVLLMSRVLAVLLKLRFALTLGWVLLAAGLEVIVVFFAGLFTSGALERSILRGMGGMRNAPEEDLLLSALSTVWGWTWVVLVVTILFLLKFRFPSNACPLPVPSSGRFPWLALLIIATVWIGIALPAQREQYHFVNHAKLVNQKSYAEALSYLVQRKPSDFPSGRRLEPNPFEYPVWEHLPPTIVLLNSNSPPWIRQVYLSHLKATLIHRFSHHGFGEGLTNVAAMFSSIERLPEGAEWTRSNQVGIAETMVKRRYLDTNNVTMAEFTARSNLLSSFRRLGVAETNLTQLSNVVAITGAQLRQAPP